LPKLAETKPGKNKITLLATGFQRNYLRIKTQILAIIAREMLPVSL